MKIKRFRVRIPARANLKEGSCHFLFFGGWANIGETGGNDTQSLSRGLHYKTLQIPVFRKRRNLQNFKSRKICH